MLKPDVQAEILALYYGEKKSVRAIALELGINRKSVAAVVARRNVALAPKKTARGSILDPYHEQVDELLKRDPFISATTIHSRIRSGGFMGGVTIVREYLAAKRKVPHRNREAFLRLEFLPGQCAQVDWGEFGDPFENGIKIHCFVMVLCYSRLLYIEFTRSEKFEDFIRCHENAFKYFGGLIPSECWYDNLSSAVTQRMGSLVRFNARFFEYMGHHTIRPHACNPARGNEKGRVEDGVKYIRSSFWAGRQFADFEALTYQAGLWRDNIANKREHRVTRKVPLLLFEAEEKAAMRPMNPHSFDTAEIFTRIVSPQFHIPYETNHYSVPWTLVGMSVTVRVNDKELAIFYRNQPVTRHARSYKKHQVITVAEHSRGLLERKPGASSERWQIAAIKSIGPHMERYLGLIESGTRSLRNELAQVLALATVFGEQEVDLCAKELLATSIVGVDNLERLLKARRLTSQDKELLPKPIQFQNQKLNRVVPTVNLDRYDALFKKNESGENT